MTRRGTVRNGVVVLEHSEDFPEGALVSVRLLKRSKPVKRAKRPPSSKKLRDLCGRAVDLPADAARKLDHYLYGRPKK